MQATLIALGGTLCLLLKIDNLASDKVVALVALVVLCQLAIGDA